MGISEEACVGANVDAGVSVAGGIGGGGALETSMPARSMSVLTLLVGSLPSVADNVGISTSPLTT